MAINYGLLATSIVSLLLIVGLPIFLAYLIIRRFKVSWWVVLTGLLTFISAQVMVYFAIKGVNSLLSTTSLFQSTTLWAPVIYALILGLLAGLFEEGTRLVGFLLLKKKAKPFRAAVGLGIGHGAFSSVLDNLYTGWTGFLVYLFVALFYNPGAQLASGKSSSVVSSTVAQIQQFWAVPWHMGFITGAEQLIVLSLQIVLAILVWKAIADRQWLWFVLAILYHTLFVGINNFLQILGWGIWSIVGILAIFFLINIYVIYSFWKTESTIEADEEYSENDDDEDDEDEEDVDNEEDEENDADDEDEEDEEDDESGSDEVDEALLPEDNTK